MKLALDEHEFSALYALYLECLRVRSRGVREWNRLPEAMRLAVTKLIEQYRTKDGLRAIDFKDGDFVSNGNGAGL